MASEAGAAYVTGIALHLRGDVRGLFFEWLREHRPDLIPLYKRLYKRGAYMHPEERQRLQRLVKGPDRPPGRFVRGRTQKAVAGESSEHTTQSAPWTPEQGRLF
jgi:DNA repair photolyase